MGYWTNTSYLNTGDHLAVANTLIAMLEDEGMRRIPRPSLRERMWYEPMQYATAMQCNMWGLAVFPGTTNWTVIKTAPLELLAERAPDAKRMRLIELCRRLGVPGFQINVYDSSPTLLVETDGYGNQLLSGYTGTIHNPDPMRFYEETLDESRLEPRFEWLPLQEVDAEKLSLALGGENSEFCDNLTSVDTLICHKPLLAVSGHDLYFIWPAGDRKAGF
jgi:hypothetical protein